MAGVSKGVKRKIDEIVKDDNPRKRNSIKRFFEVIQEESVEGLNSCAITSSHSAWKWKETLLYYESPGIKPSEKIASFDFDGTLAKTSLFRHGVNEWSILYPKCALKLAKLYKDGYKLVIFTNQAAIGRAKASKKKVIAEKTGRLIGFVKKVNLPFQIMVSTAYDSFRKPNTGMWDFVCKSCNGEVKVDKSSSFFVGDAAGRVKDHSSSDKEFAENCGLRFYTEDEFFLRDEFNTSLKRTDNI